MRRIKLVVALAAAMMVLMMAAAPAMADGLRLGGNNFSSDDNDIHFSAPNNATFFIISSTNGFNSGGDFHFDSPDISVG